MVKVNALPTTTSCSEDIPLVVKDVIANKISLPGNAASFLRLKYKSLGADKYTITSSSLFTNPDGTQVTTVLGDVNAKAINLGDMLILIEDIETEDEEDEYCKKQSCKNNTCIYNPKGIPCICQGGTFCSGPYKNLKLNHYFYKCKSKKDQLYLTLFDPLSMTSSQGVVESD